MAIAEVGAGSQRATTEFTGDSGTLAFPANVVSGNLLVVLGAVYGFPASGSPVAVTDTRSTSYTVRSALIADGLNDLTVFIAFGAALSSGACTVTVNPAGTLDGVSFYIDEFSGQHATPEDVDGGSSTGFGTAVSDSLTTLTSNDLILGVESHLSPSTITEDFTLIGEVESQVNQAGSGQFRLVTTAQAYSMTWTLDASPDWIAYTVAIKPASTAVRANYSTFPKHKIREAVLRGDIG